MKVGRDNVFEVFIFLKKRTFIIFYDNIYNVYILFFISIESQAVSCVHV